MRRLALFLACAITLLCAACAGQWSQPDEGLPRFQMQSALLAPGNGGALVGPELLAPGDILLSSTNGVSSVGVRLLTLSPVSHASLYLGKGRVAEAVTQGVRYRSLDELLEEESTVVAFRDPRVQAEHVAHMDTFAQAKVGGRYDFVGILLQVPFALERRLCEVPVMPAVLRDFCIRGVGAVQLGVARNDGFFCSQFVLEAYRQAGVPLTDADPRLMSPADLLHMREGDVPSVRTRQALRYVGHLKFEAPVVAAVAH